MEKIKLTVENRIGETKGTELEGAVRQNFTGETKEAGIYLAMARLAQRQGYPEIAEVLKTIAWEEAEHAARFAELNGMIQEDIFENIKQMLEGEIASNEGKKQAADKAAELGLILPEISLMNPQRTKPGTPGCWKGFWQGITTAARGHDRA